MEYNKALTLANELIEEIRPFCKRIEIAGGLRRHKPDPHDIELVVIPKWELEDWRLNHIKQFVKGKDKYWQLRYEGELIDIFLCTELTWPDVYFIRTGSANFVHNFMIKLRDKGLCSDKARICRISPNTGNDEFPPEPIEGIFEEKDIFKIAEIPFVNPEERI